MSAIYGWKYSTVILIMLLTLIIWSWFDGRWQRKIQWRVLNGILLLVSVYGILRFTLLGRTPGENSMFYLKKFTPYAQNPELYRELLMNVFLYFPFGLTFSRTMGAEAKHRTILTVLVAFCISFCIECTQYYMRLGLCEPSDVMMNILGAAVGSIYIKRLQGLRHRL